MKRLLHNFEMEALVKSRKGKVQPSLQAIATDLASSQRNQKMIKSTVKQYVGCQEPSESSDDITSYKK